MLNSVIFNMCVTSHHIEMIDLHKFRLFVTKQYCPIYLPTQILFCHPFTESSYVSDLMFRSVFLSCKCKYLELFFPHYITSILHLLPSGCKSTYFPITFSVKISSLRIVSILLYNLFCFFSHLHREESVPNLISYLNSDIMWEFGNLFLVSNKISMHLYTLMGCWKAYLPISLHICVLVSHFPSAVITHAESINWETC